MKDHSRVHHGCSAGAASACVLEGADLFQRREPRVLQNLFENRVCGTVFGEFLGLYAVVTADRAYSKGIIRPKFKFHPFTNYVDRGCDDFFLIHTAVLEFHRGEEFRPVTPRPSPQMQNNLKKKDRRNTKHVLILLVWCRLKS